jgi:transmembrane sensor
MKTDYSKYSIEDLITDEVFISWCLNKSQNHEFEHLLQSDAYANHINEAKKIVTDLNDKSAMIDNSEKSALWHKINESTQAKVIPMKRNWMIYAAASCLFLFVTYSFFISSDSKLKESKTIIAAKKVTNHLLPDQSKIDIQKGSSITYNQSDFQKARIVYLKGHAFFNVKKGNEFKVISEYGEVKVLGTSFDVIEKPNGIKVICYTGKVEVTSNGKKIIITPGEETAFESVEMKQISLLQGTTPGYISGKLEYSNVEIGKILEVLSQEYNVTIESPNSLKQKYFTGIINLSNIDEAMKTITWPYFHTYSINENKVTISLNAK